MSILPARHVREEATAEIATDDGARARLSPADRQHLDMCDRCQGLVEGHQRAMRALTATWQYVTVADVADQQGIQRVRGGVSGGLATGRFSVSLPIVAVAALLLLAALVGTALFAGSAPTLPSSPLGGVVVTSPDPTVVATHSATPIDTSDWVPFQSRHYGLTMSRPADSAAMPASLRWDLAIDQDPRFLLSTDRIALSFPARTFAAYGMTIPDGMTPDAFIEAYRAPNILHEGLRCFPEPETWEPIVIDGHEARLAQGCGYVEAITFVDRRVYIMSGYGGLVADRLMFDAILSTVHLHPETADDMPFGPSPSPR